MLERLIDIYANNPTEGATDGSILSANGESTAPLKVQLDASLNESKTVKLAIRTDSGYKTKVPTTITAVGDVYDRWQFSLTEDGDFTDAITIGGSIGDSNTIFYARATSSSLEHAHNDTDVSLFVSYVITSVDDTFSNDDTTAADDTTVDFLDIYDNYVLLSIYNDTYEDAAVSLVDNVVGDVRIRTITFYWNGQSKELVLAKWLGGTRIYSCLDDHNGYYYGSYYGEVGVIAAFIDDEVGRVSEKWGIGDTLYDGIEVYTADDFIPFERRTAYSRWDYTESEGWVEIGASAFVKVRELKE